LFIATLDHPGPDPCTLRQPEPKGYFCIQCGTTAQAGTIICPVCEKLLPPDDVEIETLDNFGSTVEVKIRDIAEKLFSYNGISRSLLRLRIPGVDSNDFRGQNQSSDNRSKKIKHYQTRAEQFGFKNIEALWLGHPEWRATCIQGNPGACLEWMQQADADNRQRHVNNLTNLRPRERRQDWDYRQSQYDKRPILTTHATGGNATPSLRSIVGGNVGLFTKSIRNDLTTDWLNYQPTQHEMPTTLAVHQPAMIRTNPAPPGTNRQAIGDVRLLDQATRVTSDSRNKDTTASSSSRTLNNEVEGNLRRTRGSSPAPHQQQPHDQQTPHDDAENFAGPCSAVVGTTGRSR
jgi:hypothetical protein